MRRVLCVHTGNPSAANIRKQHRLKLARRIGATRQEVNRRTNLKHATKIGRIDAALRTWGKRLYLDAARAGFSDRNPRLNRVVIRARP